MKEKEFEKIFKALGNKRRIVIVKYLRDGRPKNVGSIAEKLKLSFRSTSRHLAVLYSAGILEREQKLLQVFYNISVDLPKPIKELISSS